MKIIITGGAGFLGSNLSQLLANQGHFITCIDNLSKGNIKNIDRLIKKRNFRFLKYDVVKMLPKNLEADRIYHLASMASPNPFKKKNIYAYPFETMKVNTIATWNLCKFALLKNARLLFASTSEVYGDPLKHPQREDYRGNVSTTDPRSVYDEAKRFGETIVSAYVRNKELDGRIIRIFNTYGPKMALDDGRVVIEFIVSALQNKPLTIFGDGKQTRSFCYVDDLIRGMIIVMEKEGLGGEIFNLGNPAEFTIVELARKIKKLTKSNSKITFQEMPTLERGSPKKRRPDITKVKRVLKWAPKVNLDEGLKEMISYVQAELSS